MKSASVLKQRENLSRIIIGSQFRASAELSKSRDSESQGIIDSGRSDLGSKAQNEPKKVSNLH